jgi:hypothetical protein
MLGFRDSVTVGVIGSPQQMQTRFIARCAVACVGHMARPLRAALEQQKHSALWQGPEGNRYPRAHHVPSSRKFSRFYSELLDAF